MKRIAAVTDPSSFRNKALELLFRANALGAKEYQRVAKLMESSILRSEDVIIDHDIMTEAALLKALAGIYRTHFVSTEKLAKAEIPRSTILLLPRRVAETLGMFPVMFDPKSTRLSVVTADPDATDKIREAKLVSGAKEVVAYVTRPSAIAAAIRKHHDGDERAFARFDRQNRVVDYEFGQVVEHDGRVRGAKEVARRSSLTRALEQAGTHDPDASAPVPRDAEPSNVVSRPRSQPAAERASLSQGIDVELDFPMPEPRRRPSQDRRPAEVPTLEPPNGRQTLKAPSGAGSRPPRELAGSGSSAPQRIDIHSTPAPGRWEAVSLPPAPSGDRGIHPILADSSLELLTVMVGLLDNVRPELRGHSSLVGRLVRRMAERMGLDPMEVGALVVAAHIHDIGKMGQFHLTALNCAEYEGHRVAGQKALDTPLRLLEGVRLPSGIQKAVLHMYERFDGRGMPDRLSGKDIPLGARILAVADTYADLTQNSRNPLRCVLQPAQAVEEIAKYTESVFDPMVVELFRSLVLGQDIRAKLLAGSRRALVIEPDAEEASVLELRMVDQGFDVKIARSADAARKWFSTPGCDFDVVVSELELPDGDGLDLLAFARTATWGKNLAWMVLSRRQGRIEAQRAFDLGALDFVAKPIQTDVLVAKLKALLEQQQNSSRPLTSKSSKGVNGSLSEMGLPDLLQVLFHGRKTGKLTLHASQGDGEIHFLEGAIANAFLRELEGAQAVYAMVRLQEGQFEFDPSFVPPKRLVEESVEALLLEGMRRMDEGID